MTTTSDFEIDGTIVDYVRTFTQGVLDEASSSPVPDLLESKSYLALAQRYDTQAMLGFTPGLLILPNIVGGTESLDGIITELLDERVIEVVHSVGDDPTRRHLADFLVTVGINSGANTISQVAQRLDVSALDLYRPINEDEYCAPDLDLFNDSFFSAEIYSILLSNKGSLFHYEHLRSLVQLGGGGIGRGVKNKTMMFRNPPQLNGFQSLLRTTYAQDDSIRILSLASSTGEEAYSLATVLLGNGYLNFEIVGIDNNEHCIELAQRGLYLNQPDYFRRLTRMETEEGLIVNGAVPLFPPHPWNMGFSEEITSRVSFELGDAIALDTSRTYDLVFVNNLFGYLPDDQVVNILRGLQQITTGFIFTDSNKENDMTPFKSGVVSTYSTKGPRLFTDLVPSTDLDIHYVSNTHSVLKPK